MSADAERRPPLLQLEGINTYYGQIHILQDENLVVDEGELVCLLGGNASGKSTTLKTILGIVRPRTGRVLLDGEDVTRMPTAHRIKRGLAIVPENRRLFGPMTVLENLEMGAYLRPKADLKEEFERVYTLFPLLYERRTQLAGTLSGGEQQMVAMGRALMSQPKLLLMDEPSMGLAPVLVERSFEIIKQVNDAGVAMLIVEQNANVSLSIADRGYVLSTGRIVLEGKAADLLAERGPAQGIPRAADGCRQRSRSRSRRSAAPSSRSRRCGSSAGEPHAVGDAGHDVLLFAFAGGGELDGDASLEARRRCCSRVSRPSSSRAPTGISLVRITLGADTDLHAPMGAREHIVSIDAVEPGKATGSRSFQILFGPHNGSRRATMFVGYVPPGKAPWHYHLYDEIVWIWRGPGRYHLGDEVETARGRLRLPDHAARGAHRREHAPGARARGARHLHARRAARRPHI